MPDPHFYGGMGKRTKKAIRDQAQALAKFTKRLDAAQRKRRKAYEKRERKGQREAETEEPNFGADDIDGRAESPPPPLKSMRELLNQNSDKLHPAELAKPARQKYHHNIKEEYQKYCSEQPIPPIGSNGILLIDFDEMRYENIQGTRTTPTILHLIRRGYWALTCHRPGVAFSIRMLAACHAQVVSGVTAESL
ncbi:hypothetical protein V1517DRAFT_335104 [Lipomyces orientalis]|uniref:Uncharacterized protein n=1 Tax=Lipomyces orientalis TaxID=1233043 RepID=A0ACC3TZL1_9ASCO